MVDKEYSNAYREVIEILKYIPKEDYDKIPKSKINFYEENLNNEYDFKYNPSKTLDEQNVSEITKGIIALLFRDYWATEEQRNKILKKQKQIMMKVENEKRKKYSLDVFENHSEKVLKDNKKNEKSQKRESMLKKILEKLKIK